ALRIEAIACFALPDLRMAKEWDIAPASIISLDFDGTLERHARIDKQGKVSVHRTESDLELCALPGLGPQSWPSLSRDGQFLAVGNVAGRLQVWKLTKPKPVEVINTEGTTFAIAFSPDSRNLAVGRTDGTFSLHDLTSGKEKWLAKTPARPHSAHF